jgi:hypothetical protein
MGTQLEKCWHTDHWTDADGKSHTDLLVSLGGSRLWENHGWWEFDWNGYTATLTAQMDMTPDDKSPAATAIPPERLRRSGKRDRPCSHQPVLRGHRAQNAVNYFPEFGYQTYWRC